MFAKPSFRFIATLATLVLSMGTARADVLDMPEGVTSLETVAVGNLGNTGEWSGGSYGGSGPDAFVGAVPYNYQIGKYEVTAGQYTEFLNAVATTSDTYGLYNTSMWSDEDGCKIQQTFSSGVYTYSVAADHVDRPVNCVGWGDAARFANWLSNGQPSTGEQTLSTTEDGSYYLNGATSTAALMAVTRKSAASWVIPTEDEWYKAAYHKNDGDTGYYFDYPTGSDSAPSNDLTDPDSGNNANFDQSGYTIGSPYWMTVVGEFENSESPYGTFDQGGNLWEWNETEIYAGSSRGLRGGGWASLSDHLAASFRNLDDPTREISRTGFRVAIVPEPGSLAMLAGIAVMGLAYWRRRRV